MLYRYKLFHPRYSSIQSRFNDDPESDLLEKERFEHESLSETRTRTIHLALPWILTLAFAVITILSWVQSNPHSQCGSYETGFETDFDSVLPEIRLKEVRFTGGLRDAPNGTLILTEPVLYSAVGRPSGDVDDAWNTLTHGIDLYATREESLIIGDGLMHRFEDTGMFKMGIEWLHSLHCLNYIRKSFDYDYYTQDLHHPLQGHHTHLDHCIDALRQTLQCHGDATVLPKYVDEETGHELTDFHQVHTCRDFDMLREWADERGYDSLVVANNKNNVRSKDTQ